MLRKETLRISNKKYNHELLKIIIILLNPPATEVPIGLIYRHMLSKDVYGENVKLCLIYLVEV